MHVIEKDSVTHEQQNEDFREERLFLYYFLVLPHIKLLELMLRCNAHIFCMIAPHKRLLKDIESVCKSEYKVRLMDECFLTG